MYVNMRGASEETSLFLRYLQIFDRSSEMIGSRVSTGDTFMVFYTRKERN